jgi:branched-chain amino acid transport system substrate-binding protein
MTFRLSTRLVRLTLTVLSAGLIAVAPVARAELTVGVSLPMTGPASGLGIPMSNGVKLWPATVGGEKLRVVLLDDATDPTKGVQNARRLVSDEKVDVLLGSGATPVAVAMAEVASDTRTPQLALSPIPLPPGKDNWSFRIPHSSGVMASAMTRHMKRAGVKSVAFLGYADAYGESWLVELRPRLEQAGIALLAVERFARTDTSVTSQALKLSAARPDAVVVVASGSGAAMPQVALVERGYVGKIYQTHGAATRDLIRVGGRNVEGALVSTPAVVVADQLAADHPLRTVAMSFVEVYEKVHGAGSRNALAAHGYDAFLILDKAVALAKQKARPGTPEFRAALRDTLESMPAVTLTGGVIDYSPKDHWGYQDDSAVMMKIVNSDWKIEP